LGIGYGRSRDDRKGFENFAGTQFGVKGALRRDEQDNLSNIDPYLQAELDTGAWVLTSGLRRSRLSIEVDDRFLANGRDSGSIKYRATTPVAGVLYRVSPVLNVYVSAARGFEMPTLNELFYTAAGGDFNFGLHAARKRATRNAQGTTRGGYTDVVGQAVDGTDHFGSPVVSDVLSPSRMESFFWTSIIKSALASLLRRRSTSVCN
jgi:outer membrane receptor protein involved in Fe transport